MKIKKDNQNFHFGVCITINCLNIYYLDEIFDFFAERDLSTNFNILHLPWQLNIKVLPNEVKAAIKEKLLRYRVKEHFSDWHKSYWNSHRDMVINFLETDVEDRESHFRELHYYTRGLDRSRRQNFESALPEFASLIKPWFDQFDSDNTGLS